MDLQFESYWSAIKAGPQFDDRKEAARDEWDKHPEKQEPIMQWLQKHGPYPGRNPFFFIQDFKVRRTQQPDFLSGQQQDALRAQGIPLVQVKYGDKFLICTKQTQQDFHLTLVRDW